MQGPLHKWTNMVKGYQPRYCVVDEFSGKFHYYTSRENYFKGEVRGSMHLKDAVLGIDDADETFFTITRYNQTFHFKAKSVSLRDKWISNIEHIQGKLLKGKSIVYPKKDKISANRDFHHKLDEVDAYLDLLGQQLKILDQKIATATSDIEKSKLCQLKDQSQYFFDSAGKAILLHQISKNEKYPDDDWISNLSSASNKPRPVSRSAGTSVESDDIASTLAPLKPRPSSSSTEFTKVSTSDDNESFPNKSEPSIPSDVSEDNIDEEEDDDDDDDDDFYDANEHSVENSDIFKMNLKNKLSTPSNESNGGFNYDKIYESSDDEDMDSFQSHGSVISHLLSQVKIGMDLTKVALPTFILERRSLLEMYADFFAHADIFVSIPDYQTPQERMIQMVKWYLSAFHAGRKGSVAKKPYNPVLGEVFKCHWNISDLTSPCNSGPVPWAKTGDLAFIAEQVSHHPPISAFYAESVDKRIMCSASIWTKSKFLGLSIGVNNIGTGSVYLLDHGEEYTCNFPSAYGRSILTEPWFELGGTIDINCQQTGYSAKIEFQVKPFYGGKKHRIHAEVFGPTPTKKSIVKITGEWNGKMMAKYADSSKSELFIDTKVIPIIKKQVASISEQSEFESRNLWKVVTAALKRQDVNEATAAKYSIEQHQRDLVKEREEKSIQWQQRSFHSVGDKWCFNDPLTKRK